MKISIYSRKDAYSIENTNYFDTISILYLHGRVGNVNFNRDTPGVVQYHENICLFTKIKCRCKI